MVGATTAAARYQKPRPPPPSAAPARRRLPRQRLRHPKPQAPQPKSQRTLLPPRQLPKRPLRNPQPPRQLPKRPLRNPQPPRRLPRNPPLPRRLLPKRPRPRLSRNLQQLALNLPPANPLPKTKRNPGMNKIIIIGNLGRDPEMRYSPSGQPMTSFSIASNRRYTTAAGEQREETEWFNCTAFGRLADVCNQYLTRGQQIYVEGRLRSRQYDRRDGTPGFSLDVNVTEMQMLGRRGDQPDDSGGYGGGYGDQRGGYGDQRGSYGAPQDAGYGEPRGGGYGSYGSGGPGENSDVDDLPF